MFSSFDSNKQRSGIRRLTCSCSLLFSAWKMVIDSPWVGHFEADGRRGGEGEETGEDKGLIEEAANTDN